MAKGLGKGLDALFAEEEKQGITEVKITEVMPNKDQPRKFFDEEKLQAFELVYEDGSNTAESYAICVAKENTELLEQINKALAELTEDGTIAKIIEKYIPSGN